MNPVVSVDGFDGWRAACRGLLAAEIPPADVHFADAAEPSLFAAAAPPPPALSPARTVPRAFLPLAEAVACHRDPARWAYLYRALWRLTHGEPHLLDLAADDTVAWLRGAEKAVRRDTHKMHAFVRFRAVGDHFVAWHRPDHRVVRKAAPFFRRRFPQMRWTVLTPDESATWDGDRLHFGPGVPAKDAPPPDVLEDLWKAYYRATFNPARVKLRAMKKELPVRHWPTLPEAAIIGDMLAEAPGRVAAMAAHAEGFPASATAYLPRERDLGALRVAAAGCAACDLCRPGGRAVFGEGPPDAPLVLVSGRPTDGDDGAARVLDAALAAAGLDRRDAYLTYAVKRPGAAGGHHADACRP